MTMHPEADILATISARKASGEPFALATVVRTVAATAAKAGAKAVILPDGTIFAGWIGGGCARAAVLKAARDALADGKSRLVSIWPEDVLDERGVAAGDERSGVRFAKNMCPSQGSMDIFVEPVLPQPGVVVFGSSPVAVAIADFAKHGGFVVTVCAPAAEQLAFAEADRRIEGYALPVQETGARYLVVSTIAFAPVFFANLVFTHSFRGTAAADAAFASNLLGAVLGGCIEYVALVTGYRALVLIVISLYALAAVLATKVRLLADRELVTAT